MIWDDNTPGGYTLERHLSDNTSTGLIRSKSWNYLVLQEQSQLPSFPESDVQKYVYPSAKGLYDLARANDTCTRLVFYRTWGRKNGDSKNCPVWPPVCTYQGMDSLLALRYEQMAKDNAGLLSPVGDVWKEIRNQYPNLELYKADESHPSEVGSYAAACCFYALFFDDDSLKFNYNYVLGDSAAARVKRIVSKVLQNRSNREKWLLDAYQPEVSFSVIENKLLDVSLKGKASYVNWYWDFGNGDTTSASLDTVYTYDSAGTYQIKLLGIDCWGKKFTASQEVIVDDGSVGIVRNNEANITALRSGQLIVQQPGKFSLSVFDLQGRLLERGMGTGRMTIPTDHWPASVVVLVSDGLNTTKRLLILPRT